MSCTLFLILLLLNFSWFQSPFWVTEPLFVNLKLPFCVYTVAALGPRFVSTILITVCVPVPPSWNLSLRSLKPHCFEPTSIQTLFIYLFLDQPRNVVNLPLKKSGCALDGRHLLFRNCIQTSFWKSLVKTYSFISTLNWNVLILQNYRFRLQCWLLIVEKTIMVLWWIEVTDLIQP